MVLGCKDLEVLVEFGEERLDFFKKHTELENIPCLSTLSNIINVINPNHLELCLYGIFNNVFQVKIGIRDFGDGPQNPYLQGF